MLDSWAAGPPTSGCSERQGTKRCVLWALSAILGYRRCKPSEYHDPWVTQCNWLTRQPYLLTFSSQDLELIELREQHVQLVVGGSLQYHNCQFSSCVGHEGDAALATQALTTHGHLRPTL